MSDDDTTIIVPLRQLHRLLNQHLAFAVQARRRFIEDQDRRIGKEHR
ncbi:hypothetical protein [Trinickia mobilis]|nr:hypothetical protein [Trinickia mobilis]